MAELIVVTKVDVAVKQLAAVPGIGEYATVLVPVGQSVTANLIIGGKAVATLGPWIATRKAGRNALASLRLRVSDACGLDTLAQPVDDKVANG